VQKLKKSVDPYSEQRLPLLFSQHATVPYPTSSLPKISLMFPGNRWIACSLQRAKVLGSAQLVSEISNICDHNPPTSQTDGQTDGQATCDRKTALCTKVHSWARTRGAQLSAGYTVNTHKMVARYAPHILISPAPHTTAAASVDLFIARTLRHATNRHEAKVTVPSWKLGIAR